MRWEEEEEEEEESRAELTGEAISRLPPPQNSRWGPHLPLALWAGRIRLARFSPRAWLCLKKAPWELQKSPSME